LDAAQWSASFGDTESEDTLPQKVAITPSGEALVVGYLSGPVDFGNGAQGTPGYPDYNAFIALFDEDGTIKFSLTPGDDDIQAALAAAADPNGKVYAGGQFSGSADFGDGDETAANTEGFIARYDSSGTLELFKQLGSSDAASVTSLAVDDSGNILACGSFSGDVDFGSGSVDGFGGSDTFVAAYSASGSLLWSKVYGTSDDDASCHVAIVGSKVLVGVRLEGTLNFGGGDVTSAGGSDVHLVTLELSDGSFDAQAGPFGGSNSESLYSMHVDSTGAVLFTGVYQGGADFGGTALSDQGNGDTFLLKINSNGEVAWQKSIGGGGYDYAFGATLDGNDDLVLAGDFSDSIDIGGATLTAASADTSDVFLASFSGSDGAFSAQGGPFGDAEEDWINHAAYDKVNDRLVVVGQFRGDLDLGSGQMSTTSFFGMFMGSFQL